MFSQIWKLRFCTAVLHFVYNKRFCAVTGYKIDAVSEQAVVSFLFEPTQSDVGTQEMVKNPTSNLHKPYAQRRYIYYSSFMDKSATLHYNVVLYEVRITVACACARAFFCIHLPWY